MRAEVSDVAGRPRAEGVRVREIRQRVGQGQDDGENGAQAQRAERAPRQARARRHQQQRKRTGNQAEKRAVVDARDDLQPEKEAGQRTEPDGAFVDRPMQHPERQRHPDSPLQLEVDEVFDPIRREREDDRRHEPGAGVAGQVARQHEHAEARRDDAGEEHQVVDEHRAHAGPQERRGDDPLEQHRVGERQRARVRVVDVGVEQVRRIGRQHVRDPGQPPDAEEWIVVARHPRVQMQRLRPRQDDGQRGQQRQRAPQRMSDHGSHTNGRRVNGAACDARSTSGIERP